MHETDAETIERLREATARLRAVLDEDAELHADARREREARRRRQAFYVVVEPDVSEAEN